MAQTVQELIAERAETAGVAVRFTHADTGVLSSGRGPTTSAARGGTRLP
jgi:hypothetical protein